MKSDLIFAKLDPGFFSNRKAIRAGVLGREVYLFVLCLNAARGAHGWVPSEDLESWYLARQLGVSEQEAVTGVTAAVTANLLDLDGERVLIRGWGDDWARRKQTRAEIQHNYRERKKKGDAPQDGHESDASERYRDEVTLLPECDPLPIRGEERRSERGRGNAPDSLSLLEGYQPSERAVAIAQKRRLDLAFELEQFRDKKREKGAKFRDVDAVDGGFCAWLRQSKDVDRTPDKPMAPKGARVGAYVTRQRNGDGEHWILTEADGNQRVVTEDEASKFPGYTKRGKP